PRLDLAASLEGELPALVALAGASLPSAGRLAVDAEIRGAAARPEVTAELRLERATLGGWRPGDAVADLRISGSVLRVTRLELPTRGGRLVAHGTLGLTRPFALDAEAALEDVELGEVLERLRLPGAWVMARLRGRASVSGSAWPLQLGGEAGLEVADFRVLDHAWDRWRSGEATFLDLPRARVEGGVRIDREGVHVTEGRVRAGRGDVTARGVLHFDERRGLALSAEGQVDLSELRHLGPVPVGGLGRLEGATIRAAPYGNPHVEGQVSLDGLRFLQLDLGQASATLRYDDFVLRVGGVDGRRGATRYQGEAVVDLGHDPVLVREARYTAAGRLRDLFEAAMPWLPTAVHARDALDAEVSLRGTARGPAAALDASFEGDLGRGELFGRAFDGGRAAGRVERGAAAVFDEVRLRRAGGEVHGSGRVGFALPFPWAFQAAAERVRLSDLGLPGTGWQGTADGNATVAGSYEAPRIELRARSERVEVAEVPLGQVDLRGSLDGTQLAVEVLGDEVRVTGTARTDGDAPFQASATLALRDAFRLVPGGPPAGLHASVSGTASARGSLRDLAGAAGELRLDDVRGGYGDFQVASTGPVLVSLENRRVLLRGLALRGVNTELELAGAREVDGVLGLEARGSVDLRLLGGLLPGVTEPRGQLQLAAHVGGTLADPLLVGTGQLREAGFQVKDLPIVFSGLGGELAFSQHRMLFDGLTASVNGGRAEIGGEVELRRFFPAQVRVGAVLDEVPLRIPEWLPILVSGRLQAAGTWDAMLLSGKLHVPWARYTVPVDLEKRVVEVQRRRVVARPFDRSFEWIAFDVALAVDGDARIENDVVRGTVSGALTLTGTAASPGVVGALTLGEGSRATFRGNEFVLTHAVVDFTERRKVHMSLDVHGEAQVRDYQIFMQLSGPYEDPNVQLTSQPALSQQDLVTLLSLGYTARDAAAAAGVSGLATAAAAQALFSASGLDDQVRRFVPRGGLLRDFSVRITSAYSEGSGQVEPRAEFESKVVDDRFRLRYQAPLAGARGQRAQAEMRLSSHSSLQYQWDNDTPGVSASGDHGVDLKLRWEWSD
ncbi:MAG TPA: translocation/assembly module TamB, partial [Anaeromyxobacteraceae bacterium]